MDTACQASLSINNSWSLPRLMSIELVMPSNHLILCHPLLLPPLIFPNIRVFSNELVLRIRWPKYWSFSFSTSPSTEYSGLISIRMYWLDLLAVQGTLKSLLQHHSSKASILRYSAFLIVQLSHPYMTTEKTIALTRRTFADKVTSLLFNMLSRLVIWRRQWHPTPVLLPGKSHGWRSLVPNGVAELDTTERLHFTNNGGGNEENGDLLQKIPCIYFYTQCPQPCSKPSPTHTSTGDSWTLTGKSGSVSCGVTAPFSWVLVHKVLFVPSSNPYKSIQKYGNYLI